MENNKITVRGFYNDHISKGNATANKDFSRWANTNIIDKYSTVKIIKKRPLDIEMNIDDLIEVVSSSRITSIITKDIKEEAIKYLESILPVKEITVVEDINMNTMHSKYEEVLPLLYVDENNNFLKLNDLHKALNIDKSYSDWLRDKVVNSKFLKEGKDYFIFNSYEEAKNFLSDLGEPELEFIPENSFNGKTKRVVIVTHDTAMEISATEDTIMGRNILRYLINFYKSTIQFIKKESETNKANAEYMQKEIAETMNKRSFIANELSKAHAELYDRNKKLELQVAKLETDYNDLEEDYVMISSSLDDYMITSKYAIYGYMFLKMINSRKPETKKQTRDFDSVANHLTYHIRKNVDPTFDFGSKRLFKLMRDIGLIFTVEEDGVYKGNYPTDLAIKNNIIVPTETKKSGRFGTSVTHYKPEFTHAGIVWLATTIFSLGEAGLIRDMQSMKSDTLAKYFYHK